MHDSCVRMTPTKEDLESGDDGTLGMLLRLAHSQTEQDVEHWAIELRLLACLGLLVDQGLDFLRRDLLARDAGKEPTDDRLNRAARTKGLG